MTSLKVPNSIKSMSFCFRKWYNREYFFAIFVIACASAFLAPSPPCDILKGVSAQLCRWAHGRHELGQVFCINVSPSRMETAPAKATATIADTTDQATTKKKKKKKRQKKVVSSCELDDDESGEAAGSNKTVMLKPVAEDPAKDDTATHVASVSDVERANLVMMELLAAEEAEASEKSKKKMKGKKTLSCKEAADLEAYRASVAEAMKKAKEEEREAKERVENEEREDHLRHAAANAEEEEWDARRKAEDEREIQMRFTAVEHSDIQDGELVFEEVVSRLKAKSRIIVSADVEDAICQIYIDAQDSSLFSQQEIWRIFSGKEDGCFFRLCNRTEQGILGVQCVKGLNAFIVSYPTKSEAEKAYRFFVHAQSTKWTRNNRREAGLRIQMHSRESQRPTSIELDFALYVDGAPPGTQPRELRDLFANYGQLHEIRTIQGKDNAFFVNFADYKGATAACEAARCKELRFEGSILYANEGRNTTFVSALLADLRKSGRFSFSLDDAQRVAKQMRPDAWPPQESNVEKLLQAVPQLYTLETQQFVLVAPEASMLTQESLAALEQQAPTQDRAMGVAISAEPIVLVQEAEALTKSKKTGGKKTLHSEEGASDVAAYCASIAEAMKKAKEEEREARKKEESVDRENELWHTAANAKEEEREARRKAEDERESQMRYAAVEHSDTNTQEGEALFEEVVSRSKARSRAKADIPKGIGQLFDSKNSSPTFVATGMKAAGCPQGARCVFGRAILANILKKAGGKMSASTLCSAFYQRSDTARDHIRQGHGSFKAFLTTTALQEVVDFVADAGGGSIVLK
jgi:hypothetical protein